MKKITEYNGCVLISTDLLLAILKKAGISWKDFVDNSIEITKDDNFPMKK